MHFYLNTSWDSRGKVCQGQLLRPKYGNLSLKVEVWWLTLWGYPPSTWVVRSKHRLFHDLSFGIAKVAPGTPLRLCILCQLVVVHVFVNLGGQKNGRWQCHKNVSIQYLFHNLTWSIVPWPHIVIEGKSMSLIGLVVVLIVVKTGSSCQSWYTFEDTNYCEFMNKPYKMYSFVPEETCPISDLIM